MPQKWCEIGREAHDAGEGEDAHEMLNGRLKNWGTLYQVFRHHISLHGNVFRVCAVVTQLNIKTSVSRSLGWNMKISSTIE